LAVICFVSNESRGPVFTRNGFGGILAAAQSLGVMALEKEIETYNRELPALLAEQGKFVLIHGDEKVATFVSYEDALKAGYEKYGLKPFLVKQIQAVEQVQYFSRDLAFSCPTQAFASVLA
jgi:hypothetical protein